MLYLTIFSFLLFITIKIDTLESFKRNLRTILIGWVEPRINVFDEAQSSLKLMGEISHKYKSNITLGCNERTLVEQSLESVCMENIVKKQKKKQYKINNNVGGGEKKRNVWENVLIEFIIFIIT